jgi:hypothetical protein
MGASRMTLNGFRGKNNLVARNHGLAKLYAVHTEKNRQLARVLKPLCKHQARYLGHRLHDKNTRHNGRTGKMPLEKMLIDGYVFYAFYEPVAFKLDYLVNQQKWVTVRKYFGYRADIEQRIGAEFNGAFLPFGRFVKLVRKLMIQRMAALIRNYPALDCPADQRKVAYEVNYFMPDAFIGKSV